MHPRHAGERLSARRKLSFNYPDFHLTKTVTIPSTAAGTLNFWFNCSSSEGSTPAYDYMYVEVRSTTGTLLSTVATYSNKNKTTAGVYSLKSFSLAAYNGQTVRLQFRTTTDSRRVSGRFEDEGFKFVQLWRDDRHAEHGAGDSHQESRREGRARDDMLIEHDVDEDDHDECLRL